MAKDQWEVVSRTPIQSSKSPWEVVSVSPVGEDSSKKKKEEEEERKRREEEGGPGLEGGAPEVKKEDAKVERPEPATERVPAKEPGVLNIDNEFKPTIIKVWQELS